MKKTDVAIIMGSDSDLALMTDAAKVFDELAITYEIFILSAHRAPEETALLAKKAKQKGFKVLIAGAGGAAALPGTLASLTPLPVIGVPVMSKSMEGLDSLLSIVQMPPGVPVATVGVAAAKNAAILAGEILGVANPKVAQKIAQYKIKLKKEVVAKNQKLKNLGWQRYLALLAKK